MTAASDRDANTQRRGAEPAAIEVLHVRDLTKHFPIRTGIFRKEIARVHAVDGISFGLAAGETLSLVGESGCGKSTTARLVVRLIDATSGTIHFAGKDITNWPAKQVRSLRLNIQMVFQDPQASLDPRMTASAIVGEPLRVYHRFSKQRVDELFDLVGLNPDDGGRYPSECSGGQQQRIAIARSLALNPQVLVLDEPTSALDVSIQAQVINLLRDLQQELSLSYLFISHDLSTVRHITDRVAVMYLGKIVEVGDHSQIYEMPTHPYTQALLSAVPVPDPTRRERQRIVLTGDLPSATNPPSGCRFRTRCWKAQDVCAEVEPELLDRFGHGHPAACHFAEPDFNPFGGSGDRRTPVGPPSP